MVFCRKSERVRARMFNPVFASTKGEAWPEGVKEHSNPDNLASPCGSCGYDWEVHGVLSGSGGNVIIHPGNLLITEVEGGFQYPCIPTVFDETFEPEKLNNAQSS